MSVDTEPADAPRVDAQGPGTGSASTAVASQGAPATPETETESLGRRTLRGSVVTIAGYGGAQALRFAANLILTRMLAPEAFGTMAIINTLIVGLHLFSDVGISPAIIQNRRGDDPAFLNTAWTIQVARGGLLFLAACAIAWPAAGVYDDPLLTLLIPVVALTTIADGLCSTKLVSLHRHLQLGRFTLIELGSQAVASAVMIAWAWVSPSLWALVWGSVAGQIMRTLWSHQLRGVRNRLFWDPQIGRELFGFGKWIFLSTLLTFLCDHCDRLAFGAMVPRDVLGVYNIALMIALLPTLAIGQLGTSVLFPSYSRAIESGADFVRGFGNSRAALTVAGGYLVAGMLATGPPFMAVVYDARYADAGWMLQLLAVGAWFHVLQSSTSAALLALGRVPGLAAASMAKLVGMIVLIPAGFAWGGFAGAILGLSLANALKYGWVTGLAYRDRLPVIRSDVGFTIAVGATATGVYGLVEWLRARGASDLLAFAVAALALTSLWAPIALVLLRRRTALRSADMSTPEA
ncbi:MAG: oligosaccharide flippase family protein [Planctomycetota bacterium]